MHRLSSWSPFHGFKTDRLWIRSIAAKIASPGIVVVVVVVCGAKYRAGGGATFPRSSTEGGRFATAETVVVSWVGALVRMASAGATVVVTSAVAKVVVGSMLEF